jgi:hypothetical protein
MSTCTNQQNSKIMAAQTNNEEENSLTVLSSSAVSNSFVNKPFPPISDNA